MKIYSDYPHKSGIPITTLLEVFKALSKTGYYGVSKIIAPLVEEEVRKDLTSQLLLENHISKVVQSINAELLYFRSYAAQKWSIANNKLKKDKDDVKSHNKKVKDDIELLKKSGKPYGHLTKTLKPDPDKNNYYDRDDELLFKSSMRTISPSSQTYMVGIKRNLGIARKPRNRLSSLSEFLYIVKNVKTKHIKTMNDVLTTTEVSKAITEDYIDWLKVNGRRLKLNIILRESNVVIFRYLDPKFKEIWNRWNFCIILSVNEKKKTMRCLNIGMLNKFYKRLLVRDLFLGIKSLTNNRKIKIKAVNIKTFLKQFKLENLIVEYRMERVTYDCFKVNLKNEFIRLMDLNTEAFTITSRDILFNKFRHHNKYKGEESEDDTIQE